MKMLAASSSSPSSTSLASSSTLAPNASSSTKSPRSKCPFDRSSSSGGTQQHVNTSIMTSKDSPMDRIGSNSSVSTMTTSKDLNKCDDKDALCKAMGTLFLQHRVNRLQRDVDELQRGNNDKRKSCSWKAGWKSDYRKGATSGTQSSDALVAVSSKGDTEKDKNLSAFERNDKVQTKSRIIIADVSLLIYSLRTVYNWLKEGNCRVIVPAETLRTLDVLKKGNHCLNLAARKATRFLDEKFDFGIVADQEDPLKAGLYAQKSSEKVTVAEWRSLEMTIQGEKGEIGYSHEAIMELSHSIRETLACTMYFLRQHILYPSSWDDKQKEPSVHLALALPPPHFDCTEEANSDDLNQNIKYGQRADGSTLMQVAKELGLANGDSLIGNILIVAPTAASWLTVNPSKQPAG